MLETIKGGELVAKRPSLNHQMWQVLEGKKAIGESRHIAKLIAKEQGSRVDTIHSYKTYEAYKQSSKRFSMWVKTNYPHIKYISEIDKDVCVKYIKHREQLGLSAYTYSQDMAMISKTLDISLTKKECNVANRSLKNITNSRVDNGFRTDTERIETIIRGTGLRRNELLNLKTEDLLTSFNSVTGIMILKGSKGGKFRIVEVRKEFQEPIYNLIKDLEKGSNVIGEEIPNQLQTHRLRAEYAQNLYRELVNSNRPDALQYLTSSLGHRRISVLKHYGVEVNKK